MRGFISYFSPLRLIDVKPIEVGIWMSEASLLDQHFASIDSIVLFLRGRFHTVRLPYTRPKAFYSRDNMRRGADQEGCPIDRVLTGLCVQRSKNTASVASASLG